MLCDVWAFLCHVQTAEEARPKASNAAFSEGLVASVVAASDPALEGGGRETVRLRLVSGMSPPGLQQEEESFVSLFSNTKQQVVVQ